MREPPIRALDDLESCQAHNCQIEQLMLAAAVEQAGWFNWSVICSTNFVFLINYDLNIIPLAVSVAEADGIPQSAIVPIYQAFGGGIFDLHPADRQVGRIDSRIRQRRGNNR
jgi:hypothetical protein